MTRVISGVVIQALIVILAYRSTLSIYNILRRLFCCNAGVQAVDEPPQAYI